MLAVHNVLRSSGCLLLADKTSCLLALFVLLFGGCQTFLSGRRGVTLARIEAPEFGKVYDVSFVASSVDVIFLADAVNSGGKIENFNLQLAIKNENDSPMTVSLPIDPSSPTGPMNYIEISPFETWVLSGGSNRSFRMYLGNIRDLSRSTRAKGTLRVKILDGYFPKEIVVRKWTEADVL